jgi:Uncharacterized protein conserved in archaea
MAASLTEKTQRYGMMLAAALEAASIGTDRRGEEVMEMASAYRDDGDHFLAEEDLVNALAAYSYGYGWLDAGVRMEVLETDEDSTLFTQ